MTEEVNGLGIGDSARPIIHGDHLDFLIDGELFHPVELPNGECRLDSHGKMDILSDDYMSFLNCFDGE